MQGRVETMEDHGFAPVRRALHKIGVSYAALKAIQGQMDDFFSQLPHKCRLEEAFVRRLWHV